MNAAPAPTWGGSDKTIYKREVSNERIPLRRLLAAILLLIGILAAEMSFADVPKNEWYCYRCVAIDAEGTIADMIFMLEIKPKRTMPNRCGSG